MSRVSRQLTLLTPKKGPSLETLIFPSSFQVVREPLPFTYNSNRPIKYRNAQSLREVLNHLRRDAHPSKSGYVTCVSKKYNDCKIFITLDAKKFKEVFDKCKEKVGTTTNDAESEKLANELESLKVKEDNEKPSEPADKEKESLGEGTSTETKEEEPQNETKKESDTDTAAEKSETSDNPSDNVPEKSDNSPSDE